MASHKGCCQDRNPQASLDTSPESQTPKACLPGSTSITEAHSQQSAWLPRGLRGPWLRAANAVDKPDLTGCTHGPGARLFLPRAQGRLAASGLFPFYTQKLHVCACVCRCLPVCAQGTGQARSGPSAEPTRAHYRGRHVPQTQSARMRGLLGCPDQLRAGRDPARPRRLSPGLRPAKRERSASATTANLASPKMK